jgi:hypothetical protein
MKCDLVALLAKCFGCGQANAVARSCDEYTYHVGEWKGIWSRKYSWSKSKVEKTYGIWRTTKTIIAVMATLARVDKAIRLSGMLLPGGDGGILRSYNRILRKKMRSM